MINKIENDEEFRLKFCEILQRSGCYKIRRKMIDISYFDNRLWKLTKYLIDKNKFSVRLAKKLINRKHPVFSQRKLFEKKVKILLDLVDTTSPLRKYVEQNISMGGIDMKKEGLNLIEKMNLNEPKISDFSVVTIQGLINEEVWKISEFWRKYWEDENKGMSRMYYLRKLPPEELDKEIREFEDYDKKMSCRVKRVP
jgi:hypothetical protein